MRVVPFYILALLCVSIFACSRPTEAECDRAFDHYFNVKMKDVHTHIKKLEAVKFEERRAEFLSTCVATVEKAVIQCWLDAETLDQIERCKEPDSIL